MKTDEGDAYQMDSLWICPNCGAQRTIGAWDYEYCRECGYGAEDDDEPAPTEKEMDEQAARFGFSESELEWGDRKCDERRGT